MRKIVSAALLLTLLLGIVGCKGNSTENNASAPVGNDTATVGGASNSAQGEASPISQVPMVSVTLPVVNQSAVSKDNTVLLNNIYQNIALITQDPDVADKIIIDYLNQTDLSDSTEQMQSYAETAYSALQDTSDWLPHLSQLTFTPMRIDRDVLSLYGAYITYAGGVHAETTGRSITYNLITGHQLKLSDILIDPSDSQSLCKLVLDALSSQKGLFTEYTIAVEARFGANLPDNNDWYFSNTGLCFYFSPYEIGPYSSGTIFAEVPYNALTGILKEEYFPSERENARGTVQISAFDEKSLNQFTQFSEAVLEEGKTKVLLHSEYGVYDVRIETGSWSSDGLTFTPEHTVFASYALTPGDAIMVDSSLSENLPTLQLSYTSNGKTVNQFIAMDESGKPILSPS